MQPDRRICCCALCCCCLCCCVAATVAAVIADGAIAAAAVAAFFTAAAVVMLLLLIGCYAAAQVCLLICGSLLDAHQLPNWCTLSVHDQREQVHYKSRGSHWVSISGGMTVKKCDISTGCACMQMHGRRGAAEQQHCSNQHAQHQGVMQPTPWASSAAYTCQCVLPIQLIYLLQATGTTQSLASTNRPSASGVPHAWPRHTSLVVIFLRPLYTAPSESPSSLVITAVHPCCVHYIASIRLFAKMAPSMQQFIINNCSYRTSDLRAPVCVFQSGNPQVQ